MVKPIVIGVLIGYGIVFTVLFSAYFSLIAFERKLDRWLKRRKS